MNKFEYIILKRKERGLYPYTRKQLEIRYKLERRYNSPKETIQILLTEYLIEGIPLYTL